MQPSEPVTQPPGAIDPPEGQGQPLSGRSPQWPGERHPTRWDVHDANESLATSFLEQYKTLLLHSNEANAARERISPIERGPLDVDEEQRRPPSDDLGHVQVSTPSPLR